MLTKLKFITDMETKKEALKAAEKSLEMAKKTGNHHSIGMSTRALKEVQESP